MDILLRLLDVLEEFRNMRELNDFTVALFSAMVLFGLCNCILGYRLMRFWMMLGGFAAGCACGFLISNFMGLDSGGDTIILMLIVGVVLGAIAFFVYRLGVFLMGAGLGLCLGIYILHPTSSSVFFLCLLLGVAAGALTVRFSKGIIIVGTSLAGGAFAGFGISRLLEVPEIPNGIVISAGIALLGLVIQFAINRPKEEPGKEESKPNPEESYDAWDEEAYEEVYQEMYGDQPVSHIPIGKIRDIRSKKGSAEKTRRSASPYSQEDSVIVDLKKPQKKNKELKIPLSEWEDQPNKKSRSKKKQED